MSLQLEEIALLSISGLDLSGGSSIRPFLPVIIESFGGSVFDASICSFLYGFLQMTTGPIIGKFSDNTGRKKLLQISFLASSITPLLILFINIFNLHYYFLFISVIPMSIFRHSQSCIKGIIADKSNIDENKTFTLMAKWSSCCYIGSTIGPFLVSFVNDGDVLNINNICLLSILLFMIAFGITTYFIPNTTNKFKARINTNKSLFNSNIFSFKFPNQTVKKLVFYHFVVYFALNLYRSGFILTLKHKFNLEINELALILSYKGVIGFIMQIYLTQINKNRHSKYIDPQRRKKLENFVEKTNRKFKEENIAKYDEHYLLRGGTICLAVSMILFGLAKERNRLYIILILQECGESIFRTSFQTIFAKEVSNTDSAQTYIGLVDALSSFNRCITPLIFGIIPRKYSMAPAIAGCCNLALFITNKSGTFIKKQL